MNLFDCYDSGHQAGIEMNDACPHLPFTLEWWWWHAGNAVGHHTLCTQLEAISIAFPEDES